ncbi:MAG: SEC-C domain-containing protein, partial [Clostridia bacterium]|nr:SEC-C domain-containing protein [Clostridia bacterium]
RILINNVDQKWMDHIDQMSIMKNEIILRQYGQQDPVVAYKNEGFELFDNMINEIQEDTCMHALNANIGVNVHQTQQPIFRPINVVESGTTSGGTGEKSQAKAENTVGRNDLCPCGSGKKYKNCCGANHE